MRPDDFIQKNYQYFQQWHHWHDKAKSLRAQARVLYANARSDLRRFEKALKAAHRELRKRPVVPIEAIEPDIMAAVALYGTALENVFKALIISNNRSLIGAHKLSAKVKSHNLVELAKAAGIAVPSREQYLLKWVSEVVIWKGRYPVPTKARDGFVHPLDYQVTLTSARERFKTLDILFDRAGKALPRHRKKVKYGVLVRLDE
jgi:hypothetical protein